ncbi:restriction endonuclease subunit S [Paenibacillus sp. NEAU-GSW1]|uniref:restriction endonuclease subunit S n=1 Tax=Paenibacillus sp. NEAU-GSW1 TaxID=2682486 RepID=UPI0012E1A1A3|nr:restriction endonuclease subunit S [Paenibacillus sp. NEAU-GSW1]MUT64921.1 hypothetical protein [Paenibacillus sp. NEAU-GSW1]
MLQIFEILSSELSAIWTAPKHNSKINIEEAKTGLNFVSLGEVASRVSGQYIPEYTEVGVPYLRVDNIRQLIANFSEGDVAFISEVDASRLWKRYKCTPSDILISRTASLGKAVLTTSHFSSITLSQHVTAIRIKEEAPVLPSTVCLFLNSALGKSQLNSNAMGSTRLELSHAALEEIQVPLLPMELQNKYYDQLTSTLEKYYDLFYKIKDLLIETDNLLFKNKLLEMSFSRSYEVFSTETSQLDEYWFPNRYLPKKQSILKELELDFSCLKISDFADVSRGKGTNVSEYEKDGIPFLRTSSLINNGVDPFTDHYANQETYKKFSQPILDGDILFSMEGKIGQVALLFEKSQVVFKNHIELIRIKNMVSSFKDSKGLSGWLFLVLSGTLGKIQIQKNAVVQSTLPGLASRLRDFIIPISSIGSPFETDQMVDLGEKAFQYLTEYMEVILDLRKLQISFDSDLLSNE